MHPLISYFAAQDSPGIYLGFGAFQIQLGNLIVILVMILLFGWPSSCRSRAGRNGHEHP
ncbi:hypothetical protein [Cryobacterium sp. 10C3]|uniref:hypothetical protein n=1 Tax=Cryobacterium sp. 10C3 TaxID=3048577 RepID=UPI002AB3C6F6|nr:hypothetical protein [Cryobacterium sp. 10C3]MDY7556750.1 hypothetical protein [Cryobacterium sp. 10C3]